MNFDPFTAATDRLLGERMSKHTPENWSADGLKIIASNGFVVAKVSAPDERTKGKEWHIENEYCHANARRIVACVNACAGMDDPAAEIEKLQRQNAELLEALEGPTHVPSKCNRHGGYGFVSDCVVCKAIAKAKEST